LEEGKRGAGTTRSSMLFVGTLPGSKKREGKGEKRKKRSSRSRSRISLDGYAESLVDCSVSAKGRREKKKRGALPVLNLRSPREGSRLLGEVRIDRPTVNNLEKKKREKGGKKGNPQLFL